MRLLQPMCELCRRVLDVQRAPAKLAQQHTCINNSPQGRQPVHEALGAEVRHSKGSGADDCLWKKSLWQRCHHQQTTNWRESPSGTQMCCSLQRPKCSSTVFGSRPRLSRAGSSTADWRTTRSASCVLAQMGAAPNQQARNAVLEKVCTSLADEWIARQQQSVHLQATYKNV